MADRDLCGRTLGEFVLREQIGEGGGGTVYRCFQPSLQRHAVVKVLREPKRGDNGAKERFLREAQLASQLDHPCAAHVYAFGAEPDGVLWIAMELVKGTTLEAWIRKRGAMPPEEFVPVFECVAEAVSCAHGRGIIHRDLKPSNVMLTEHGGRRIAKLLDFGIAKADNESIALSLEPLVKATRRADADGPVTRRDPAERDWHLTPSDAGIGSAPYMSPEQWDDARTVGPASDIYSLGVLAYQALTGRVPFPPRTRPSAARGISTWSRRRSAATSRRPSIARSGALWPRHLRRGTAAPSIWRRSCAARCRRVCANCSARRQGGGPLEPGGLGSSGAARRSPMSTAGRARLRRERSRSWNVRSWRPAGRARGISYGFGASWPPLASRSRSAHSPTGRCCTRGWTSNCACSPSSSRAARHCCTNELGEARLHLAEAYRRGERSPATEFMLARAEEPTRAELARLTGVSGRMWYAAFSPNGREIVTTDDRSAQVWDAATGRRLYLLPHPGAVFHAAYSPDGAWLATAGGDGAVRIWDAASGKLLRELTRDGKRPRYRLLAVSSDRRLVAAITLSGETTYVWESDAGKLVAEVENQNASVFSALALSPDARWLATGGGGEARVISTATWKPVLTVGPRVRSFSFDPRGERIAVGTAGGDAAIWNVLDGERIRHLREVGESVDRIAWSPDGALVAAGSHDGAVQMLRGPEDVVRVAGLLLARSLLDHLATCSLSQVRANVRAMGRSSGLDRVVVVLALAGITGGAWADKLVVTKRYTFTPPQDDPNPFPLDYKGDGPTLHLQLGDRILFRKGTKASTMNFVHHCFKEGFSIFGFSLTDNKDVATNDTFNPIPTFKFDLKLAGGTHPLEINPPMVFVTIADATLTAAVSRYDNSQTYNNAKAHNPCQPDYEHQRDRTTAMHASPADIVVMVCRAGVGGHDKECD